MLILLSGLPGSGKSALARAYVKSFGGSHINSDLVRADLGLRGQYQPSDKELVYRTMLNRTREALLRGETVVVDSTFFRQKVLAPFLQLATDCGLDARLIDVTASEKTIRKRLKTPRTDSEADFEIYQKIRDQHEPLDFPHLTLQTDQATPESLAAQLHDYLTAPNMTDHQIRHIVAAGLFPGEKSPAQLVETHISWVILTPEFAFKIKKPVRFDFLDFSTPEKRDHFCHEELRLNRRLSPEMYLGVLPVGTQNGNPVIGSDTPPVRDFAVQMRRMDETRQMDLLLKKNEVAPADMEKLAATLTDFHQKNTLPYPETEPDPAAALWQDFADIFHEKHDLETLFGQEAKALLKKWQAELSAFIQQHADRLASRARSGFWVDGHGDLHGRNIFLPADGHPVVFDCIEFNPHFRRLDVLNELAFLCMDLEKHGRADLGDVFFKAYRLAWDIVPEPEDAQLFLFFKAYRANVRLKVTALELRQHKTEELKTAAASYWQMLKKYLAQAVPV